MHAQRNQYRRRSILLGTLIIIACAVSVIGILRSDSSHAATASVAIEPESGAIAIPAQTVSDASASGARAVKFMTNQTGSTPGCPVYPAFPNDGCTGWQHTGVTLAAYTGPDTIDIDGTVIDGKDINTCLYITANNVTIKNSRIRCAGASPTDGGIMIVQQSNYYTPNTTGLTLTDVEITRPTGSNGGADYGLQIYGKNVTLTRVNIHNLTSGVHFSGGGPVLIQDSYIHDLIDISGQDHNDDVIANGGATNVQLIHNNFEVQYAQTTPIAMYPEGKPNSYWTIDKNLLNGGGACIYPGYTKGSEQPNHHITVTNNHFGRKFFPNCGNGGAVDTGRNGAQFLDGTSNVWANNVWDDTGATVLSN